MNWRYFHNGKVHCPRYKEPVYRKMCIDCGFKKSIDIRNARVNCEFKEPGKVN